MIYMTERKKRNVIIISLCGVLLLMVVGYAAFNTLLTINGTTSITSNWDIKITSIKQNTKEGDATDEGPQVVDDLSATFKVNLVSPGDYITYDVTIENNGNIDAELNKIILPQLNNEAVLITTTGLAAGDELLADHSTTLTVKIEYNPEVTKQPENKTASFEMKLDYVQKNKAEAPAQTVIDMKGIEVPIVTKDDGLYADEYEPGRYVYKGGEPNNYITFNGEVAGWRIISVETDGTIKIMKNTSIGLLPFDSAEARTTGYCSQINAATNGCNVWAKTDYFINTNGQFKGVVKKDSELKIYLETKYYQTISANTNAIAQNHIWYYGSTLYNEENLTTMITYEKKFFCNSNIGLIQPSDYIKANSNTSQCGTAKLHFDNKDICKPTNWMTPSSRSYWTLSGDIDHHVLSVSLYGAFIYNPSAKGTGTDVKPTLYLKSDIELEGEGTPTHPYTITNY